MENLFSRQRGGQELLNRLQQFVNIEGLVKNRNTPMGEGRFLLNHFTQGGGTDQNRDARGRSIHPELLQHEHPLRVLAEHEAKDNERGGIGSTHAFFLRPFAFLRFSATLN
jgi:hypothetical protein